jgi:hypothetical protein
MQRQLHVHLTDPLLAIDIEEIKLTLLSIILINGTINFLA